MSLQEHIVRPGAGPAPDPKAQLACTCFNLRKAARATTQLYDAALAPTGLAATQYTVLAVTASTGESTIGGLAETLVMDRTTLTRNLKPLEKAGLIRIRPGRDRRARLVSLTAAGKAALAKARPLWRKAQKRMVAGLDGNRWARMLGDLDLVVSVAQGSVDAVR